MDGTRHDLLAGPGFAQDQDIGIGLSDLADETAHLLNALALAHQQPQQRLTLVMDLLFRVQGDKRLTKVQMSGKGFIRKRCLGHTDKVAIGQRYLGQGDERGAGILLEQRAQGTIHQLADQHPLQGTRGFDGHVEIRLGDLLPRHTHEGEHCTQLLAPSDIRIHYQHAHCHHIHPSSPTVFILPPPPRGRGQCTRRTKCQNSGALSKTVAPECVLASIAATDVAIRRGLPQ